MVFLQSFKVYQVLLQFSSHFFSSLWQTLVIHFLLYLLLSRHCTKCGDRSWKFTVQVYWGTSYDDVYDVECALECG